MINNFKIDFIGIGGQKCATSWAFKCLSEHPQVCVCTSKETHFFNNEEKFSRGLSFYQEHFQHCTDKQVVGEFSSDYLGSSAVPDRIKQFFPQVKLIAILRQPADRAWSHYLHLQSKNAIAKDESLVAAITKFPEIIEYSLYGKYLAKYLDLFSQDQILILWYEDIQKDAISFVRKIYKFLGVAEDFIPKIINQKYHSTEVRSSVVYKNINKLYIELNQRWWGKVLINIFRSVGLNSYRINRLIHKSQSIKPQISDENRAYLQAKFMADLVKLEQLTGKDLSTWR